MILDNEMLLMGMMGPQPNAQGQAGGSMLSMMVPMLLIFGVFYFMLIRPQQRKEKERQKMIDAVKSGDRVLFSGGIFGTVANVKDQVLVVKVAEGVKVEIVRGAINRVLDKNEKVESLEETK